MNSTNITLDENQDHILREQLGTGEKVTWLGQEPRSRYISNRILGIVGSLFVVLFAGFFTVLMLLMNPNIFQGSVQGLLPVLIPLVIFGAGVYSLVRAVIHFRKGRPAMYLVTDRRAMLIEQGARIEVKSYGPDAVNVMQITRRKNGSGKIIFERIASWERDSEGRSYRRVVEIGFFGVPSVDEVCRHLRQITPPTPIVSLGGDMLPASFSPEVDAVSDLFAVETSAFHESLYKIFLLSNHVCGARIAGSFSSTGLKHMGDVSGYGFLFSTIANRIANGEARREARYLQVNPLSPDFLSTDKANFRYGSLDIDHVEMHEEYKTLDSGYNASGRFDLHLRDGKVRKFWLTRSAVPAAVAELFGMNGIRVLTAMQRAHA